MGKKKADIEKEYYRLWIEYLRLSDNYKDYCEIIRKRRKNPSLSFPDKFDGKGLRYISNYYMFGPIHGKEWTFEEWWKFFKECRSFHADYPVYSHIVRKALGITEEFQPKKIVEDYSEYLQSDIKHCIDQYKFYNEGKEPTLYEFIEYFLNELRNGYLSGYITIRVDPRGKTTGDIVKHIGKLIKEKRKNPKTKNEEYNFIRYFKPIFKYETIDELWTYLKVYKLREQGLDTHEVIKKLEPKTKKEEKGYDSIYRKYNLFYQKAKNVKENAEYGFFPVYSKRRKAKIS